MCKKRRPRELESSRESTEREKLEKSTSSSFFMISWAHLQVEYYISIILAIGCDKLRPQEWSNQHTDDLKTELLLQLKLTEGVSELKA